MNCSGARDTQLIAQFHSAIPSCWVQRLAQLCWHNFMLHWHSQATDPWDGHLALYNKKARNTGSLYLHWFVQNTTADGNWSFSWINSAMCTVWYQLNKRSSFLLWFRLCKMSSGRFSGERAWNVPLCLCANSPATIHYINNQTLKTNNINHWRRWQVVEWKISSK